MSITLTSPLAGTINLPDSDREGRIVRPEGYDRDTMRGGANARGEDPPLGDDRYVWYWETMDEAKKDELIAFKEAAESLPVNVDREAGADFVGILDNIVINPDTNWLGDESGDYNVGLSIRYDVGQLVPEITTKLSFMTDPFDFIQLMNGDDLKLENA